MQKNDVNTIIWAAKSLSPSICFAIWNVETPVGGPIALVEEGDLIKINIKEKTLDFVVSDEELARRKAAWTPREPKVTTGYLARYATMVTSGDKGAVLKANK